LKRRICRDEQPPKPLVAPRRITPLIASRAVASRAAASWAVASFCVSDRSVANNVANIAANNIVACCDPSLHMPATLANSTKLNSIRTSITIAELNPSNYPPASRAIRRDPLSHLD